MLSPDVIMYVCYCDGCEITWIVHMSKTWIVHYSDVIMKAMASRYHRRLDCFPSRLLRRRSKKTSKLRVTGLFEGNHWWSVDSHHKGPVTREMFLFIKVIIYTRCLHCWIISGFLQQHSSFPHVLSRLHTTQNHVQHAQWLPWASNSLYCITPLRTHMNPSRSKFILGDKFALSMEWICIHFLKLFHYRHL